MDKEDILDLLDDEAAELVSMRPWRHGYIQTHKVDIDGRPHLVTTKVHSSEGIQPDEGVKVVPARKVMREVWVADAEAVAARGAAGTIGE